MPPSPLPPGQAPIDGEPTNPTRPVGEDAAAETRAAIARSTHRIEDGVDALQEGVVEIRATQREHSHALARIETAQARPSALSTILTEPLWPPKTGTAIVVVLLLIGAVWAIGAGQVERFLGLLPGVGAVGVAP